MMAASPWSAEPWGHSAGVAMEDLFKMGQWGFTRHPWNRGA